MSKILILISLLSLSVLISSQCPGSNNTTPLLTATPQLLGSVPNGQKYIMQNSTDNYVYIGVFSGTNYDVGYAYGQLFGEEMANVYNLMWDWCVNWLKTSTTLPSWLKWVQLLPDSAIEAVADALLADEYFATYFWTPETWEQEFEGMAAGSGVDLRRIQFFNLIPELTRAACSIYGTWGPATANHGLIHLRALDWDDEAPMYIYPMVTVYNFSTPGSQVFANFGWSGIIGSLAGYSYLIGIGEKMWGCGAHQCSEYGIPWMYLLRDTLQVATDLESAMTVLHTANKTWAINVAVSSRLDNELEIVQQDTDIFNVIAEHNETVTCSNPDDHPVRPGLLYMDVYSDFSCNPCVGNLFANEYGNITASWLARNPAPMSQSGDTILAVYDFDANFVYIAFSYNGTPAYSRSQIALNMTMLFDIQV